MNLRFIRTLVYITCYLIKTAPLRASMKKLYETDPAEASRISNASVAGALKKIMKISGSTVEVEGLDNIPDGACLYVGNHQSYFDVVAVGSIIPGGVGFVAKDSLGKIPGLKAWMDLIHCLLLDRSDAKEGFKILLRGANYLKEGYPMFIFPEGTRSKDGSLLEFKGGSLKIAQKAKCPIVPVAIYGTKEIYEANHSFKITPSHVKVTFCKPIEIAAIPKAEQKLLLDDIKETIETLLVNQEN